MSVTKYNMHGKVEEFIKVAEKALFEAKRCHERLDKQPPKGERGEKGDKGERGERGADGKDGKDSTVPGPAGRDGLHGRPAKDCECKTAIAEQHIVRLTQKLAESSDTLSAVRAEFADLKMQIAAVRSMMTKSKEYIEFLTANAAKLAARKK